MISYELASEWLRLSQDGKDLVWVKSNGGPAIAGEPTGGNLESRVTVAGKRLVKKKLLGLLRDRVWPARQIVNSEDLTLTGSDELTLSRLHELLHYSVITGEFYWKVAVSNRAAGSAAGFTTDRGRYKRVTIGGVMYASHRLAWFYVTGAWPIEQIDHENLDGLDNSWINLREATFSENMRNRTSTCKVLKGVKQVPCGKYHAYCKVDKINHHLGSFDTAEEAKQARDDFAKEHHGEFFRP